MADLPSAFVFQHSFFAALLHGGLFPGTLSTRVAAFPLSPSSSLGVPSSHLSCSLPIPFPFHWSSSTTSSVIGCLAPAAAESVSIATVKALFPQSGGLGSRLRYGDPEHWWTAYPFASPRGFIGDQPLTEPEKNSGVEIAINCRFERREDPGDEVDVPVISIPESPGFFVSSWSPGETLGKGNEISFYWLAVSRNNQAQEPILEPPSPIQGPMSHHDHIMLAFQAIFRFKLRAKKLAPPIREAPDWPIRIQEISWTKCKQFSKHVLFHGLRWKLNMAWEESFSFSVETTFGVQNRQWRRSKEGFSEDFLSSSSQESKKRGDSLYLRSRFQIKSVSKMHRGRQMY